MCIRYQGLREAAPELSQRRSKGRCHAVGASFWVEGEGGLGGPLAMLLEENLESKKEASVRERGGGGRGVHGSTNTEQHAGSECLGCGCQVDGNVL